MLKKIFCLTLALLLTIGCLASCGKDAADGAESASDPAENTESLGTPADTDAPPAPSDDESDDADAPPAPSDDDDFDTSTTLALNASTKGLKLLGGRTVATDSAVLLDWAGSGLEFTLYNSGATVTFAVQTNGACHFKVYMNGALVSPVTGGDTFEVNGNGMITVTGMRGGEHLVRLVKISDAAVATATVSSVIYTGLVSETAPTQKDLYIEFVSDDACNGADVTKGYAYQAALGRSADYSILCGAELALGGAKEANATYGKTSVYRDDIAYGFERKADIVVVDLGKADASVSVDTFAEKYEALLEQVMTQNGEDCRIVCVYDSFDTETAQAIQDLCEELGGQAAGYYTVQMAVGEDGVLSPEEQTAFVSTLNTIIGYACDGIVVESKLKTEANGDGLNVSYKDDFTKVEV